SAISSSAGAESEVHAVAVRARASEDAREEARSERMGCSLLEMPCLQHGSRQVQMPAIRTLARRAIRAGTVVPRARTTARTWHARAIRLPPRSVGIVLALVLVTCTAMLSVGRDEYDKRLTLPHGDANYHYVYLPSLW